MEVKGKVSLVTGGARGLGRGFAEELLKRGSQVVIADILEEMGRKTQHELRKKYGTKNVKFFKGDVTKSDDMEGVFEATVQKFGGLDILINNAAVGGHFTLEKTYDINVFGVIRCCDLALERMRQDKGGRGGTIVNIASIYGLHPKSDCVAYTSSKHAIVDYTNSYGKQLEVEKCGVRMLGLCPGYMKTDMTESMQMLIAEDDAKMIEIVRFYGGWTPMSTVVDACVRMIETDMPSGSLVKADNTGVGMAELDSLAFTPLPETSLPRE